MPFGRKTIDLPDLFSGRSLEAGGNVGSRKMITHDITRLIVLLTFVR